MLLTAADVTGFLNDNSWRYLEVLHTLNDLLTRYALSNKGRTIVHSIYSRGHKQRGGHEFKACWQIKWKVNQGRENGDVGFAIQDLDDIIGITVVCNFYNQIDSVVDFLRLDPEAKSAVELDEKPPKDEGGYRARHFVAQLRDRTYAGVLCEIQMKSVLDDAWARWQHDLTYKPRGPLPERVGERMASVSHLLREIGGQTQSFKDEIERNWERDRRLKDAARLRLGRLIDTDIKPPAGRRRAEFKDILSDLLRHDRDYATGDVDEILERIRKFALPTYDLHSCWALMRLAGLRANDDLDFVALDHLDRTIARATDAEQKALALNLKAIALFLFYELVDAVEASDLALEAAERSSKKDVIVMCKANLAYHAAELGDIRWARRARELVDELVRARGGEDRLRDYEYDTVGLVKIVFGRTRAEVEHGRELCRVSIEKSSSDEREEAEAFYGIHDQLGSERLELDDEATEVLKRRGWNHALYFELDGSEKIVPLKALRPAKTPKGELPSVLTARARMAEAAERLGARRPPLTVRRRGRVYEIVDGKSTYAVAVEAGWPDLPVTLTET